MKYLIALFFSFNVFAEVAQEHVSEMLEQMVRNKVISQEEAEKAKIKMKTMNPDQWAAINQKAELAASRSPASVSQISGNSIGEVHKIDLDGAQFKQIQQDIKQVIPEYKE